MLRIVMAVALALTLWGCPSNTITRLSSASAPPAWRIVFRHGSIRSEPATFIQHIYRVRSGEATVWEITLDTTQAGCDPSGRTGPAGGRRFPEEISYGTVPACYRETVAAQPLEEGRAYLLTSDDARYNHNLHAIQFPFLMERGQVREISSGRYTDMTKGAD